MENQINADVQNTQQTGQNPVNQPVLTPEKPKINYLAMTGVILVCFVVFGFGGYYLGKQSPQSQKYVNGGQNQAPPTTTPQTNNPSSTPDQTENWKTVVNTTLGISFKYPKTWSMKAFVGDQENYNNNETTYTSFSIGDESSPGTYINFGRDNDPSLTTMPVIQDGQVKLISTTNQTIDNVVFEKQVFNLYFNSTPKDVFASVSLISKSKNLVLGISYSKLNDVESEKVIDQILSTFKFTN